MESQSSPRDQNLLSLKDLPLSLLETCFLYVVGHLNQYTPDILSLLPTPLKSQLLLCLPAVDLHQLEGTVVMDRIADTSLYWKSLLDHVKKVIHTSEDGGHGFCSALCDSPYLEGICYDKERSVAESKETYLHGVALHVALPRKTYPNPFYYDLQPKPRYSYPIAKLFCLPCQFRFDHSDSISFKYAKSIFESCGLSYFSPSDGLMIPSRLQCAYFTVPWDDKSKASALWLMRILVDVFEYRAPVLPLDSTYDGYYSDVNNADVIKPFFSRVKTITIPHDCAWKYESPPEILEDVLKVNLAPENDGVRKLYISPNVFLGQIEMLSPYLCVDSSSATPYRGLCEIEIYCIGDQKEAVQFSTSSGDLLQMLATLIRNQKQLETVRLQGVFPPTCSCDALMVALADLVSQPSVKELKLIGEKGSEVNLGPISQVLLSYSFSPSANDQLLMLCGFKFRKSESRSQFLLGQHSDVLQQNKKSLDLSYLDLSPLEPRLLQVPPVCLKCIELSTLHTCSTSPPETHSHLPNLTAKKVVFEFEKECSSEVDGTAASLVLNSRIECLCVLSHYYPIPASYLASLGNVIAKHAELFQTLKSITICNAQSVDDPTFCNSLVSLGQAVPLELKFQNMVSSLKLLHKIWKEASPSQKFRKLVIFKYPGYENDAVHFQEMADSVEGVTEHLLD